jgi:hypothetical protein
MAGSSPAKTPGTGHTYKRTNRYRYKSRNFQICVISFCIPGVHHEARRKAGDWERGMHLEHFSSIPKKRTEFFI